MKEGIAKKISAMMENRLNFLVFERIYYLFSSFRGTQCQN
jgi:hypothetical protein